MNQEKIGKFIASVRKENKLTQEELAQFLGVSINAVSKWERGICLMDMSLLKPLCEKLNISVNELLSAKRLNNEEYKTTSEENILNIVNEQTKINKIYKIYFICLGILCLLLILFLIGFYFGKVYQNYEGKAHIAVSAIADCQNKKIKYLEDENSTLYYYCLNNLEINENITLKKYFQKKNKNIIAGIDDLLEHIDVIKTDYIYEGGTSISYTDNAVIIKCNTFDGNKDVFIGPASMDVTSSLEAGICGYNYDKTKVYTNYYINKINYQDNNGYYELVISKNKESLEMEVVKVKSNKTLEEEKDYDFVFLSKDGHLSGSIKDIFQNYELIEIDRFPKAIYV